MSAKSKLKEMRERDGTLTIKDLHELIELVGNEVDEEASQTSERKREFHIDGT